MVTSSNNSAVVNWTAPPTPETSVGITYCVDVVSTTSSATLHSECQIDETGFAYHLPYRSWCHILNFIVTPVNPAGNGTKMNITFSQGFLGM